MKTKNISIKKEYISLPQGQIHFRMNNIETGTPLILLHRTPSSSNMYIPMMNEMIEQRPLFAFDTPGFGGSFNPIGSPEMKDYRDWICKSIDIIGIKDFHIYAHHTGTHIAAEIGNIWNDRTVSLMLNGVAYLSKEEREAFKRMTSTSIEPDINGKYLMETFELMKSLFPEYNSDLVNQELLGALRSLEGRKQAFSAVWQQDFKSLIQTIQSPLLVMSAIDDFFYEKLEIIKNELKTARIEVLGKSGIASTELQTKKTVQIISKFMKESEDAKA
jgi:pimeloyl-ACP methyl ester carboxylesterase